MKNELIQGFLAQAESQLPTVRGGILACAQEGNRYGALNTALRQTTAIKDAAEIVELETVAAIAERLEAKLKILIGEKEPLADGDSRALLDNLTELEILLAQIRFETEDFTIDVGDFVETSFESLWASAADGESEPNAEEEAAAEDGFEIDEEMLEIFSLEAEELIQSISQNLKVLETAPNSREALLEIRRNAHTLKGSAGIVGLKRLSEAGHRVEDLLDFLAENEIEADEKIFELLLTSTDCFSALASGENSPQLTKKIARLYENFDAVLAELKAVGSRQSAVGGQPPLAVNSELPSENSGQPTADGGQPTANSEPPAVNEQRATNNEQSSKSVVRVSLEKLDDLVKIVGGLVISRSIFEQRLAELEQQIGEVHNSTRRLQQATNKLETDFEADMLNTVSRPLAVGSRQSAVGSFQFAGNSTQRINPQSQIPNPQSFDSLELDRYTDFHQTMRVLVETTSDTSAINSELDNLRGNLELLFENQRRLIEEMQDKLLRLRLVSFGSLGVRLQRTVRVTCDEEGKSADLFIEGEDIEVDTQILDSLIEPLLHLLRNAVAHGIEPPEMRRLLGKPETGRIRVRVKSEGTHIILKISDDGRGIFADGLKEKAVRNEFITKAQADKMSDEEAFALIFLPGLTTTDKISQVSGRGVGMNIVKQSVERQQGTISIESETQTGTTFTVRLPMALAVTRALLVKADEQTFAFPIKLVRQASEISAAEMYRAKSENSLRVGEASYPVFYLNEMLGQTARQMSGDEIVPVLLLETLENPCALVVDEVVKPEEIVIKPLGSLLQNLSGLLGATILGDGSVVPVLDLIYLLKQKSESSGAEHAAHIAESKPKVQKQKSKIQKPLSVMIVDDSPSVRHLTSNIIKNAGWTATVAKDGLDALHILQDLRELPDVILSDVEMPRMDGYEFLASLKRHENLQTIPVVMITSRANKKHQQKAFDLGVSEYLTKPFDDAKLIETIKNLTA